MTAALGDLVEVPVEPSVEDVDRLLERLRAGLRSLGPVVVAFSGGADSALVARVAHEELGSERCVVATAVSASLAASERADARALAEEWSLRWVEVATDELDDAAYLANDRDRCFHCKSALMKALGPVAAAEGATVVLGVNLDDLSDHRPGQRAAADGGARFPLVEAGFTKAAVRAASRRLGLRTWDKPAAPCLSSRIPYGTPVTLRVLSAVERAEAAVRALGFEELRVRHYGELARVEVPAADIGALVERRQAVVAAVRSAGYRYVTVDLEGLRSGNLNGA